MTGIFSGIIGSLIGAGIQAAVGGIPVSEDASKALDVLRTGGLPVPPSNWFSPTVTREQNTPQVQPHDQIVQHITGAHQVLNSCMRIAKALEDVAHSRSAAKPSAEAWTPGAEFARSKSSFCKTSPASEPVSLSTIGVSKKNCGCRCLHVCDSASAIIKRTENTVKRTEPVEKEIWNISKLVEDQRRLEMEKSSASLPDNRMVKIKKENHCEELINNVEKSLPRNKMISHLEKEKMVRNDLRDGNLKRDKFMNSTKIDDSKYSLKENHLHKPSPVSKKGKNQFANSGNKYKNKSDCQTCQICRSQVQNRNKSKLMPCGHIFCRGCLTIQTIFKCPICGVKSETI